MLEDYRKVMVDRMGDVEQFTAAHIDACMEKGIHFMLSFAILRLTSLDFFWSMDLLIVTLMVGFEILDD